MDQTRNSCNSSLALFMDVKKKYIFVLLLLGFTCYGNPSITYSINTGRLGDHIITYLKCRRAAQIHNLNFIPKAFEHSEHFFISIRTPNLPYKRIRIRSEAEIKHHLNTDILLISDIFFNIDLLDAIKDPEYKAMIQKIFLIKPEVKITIPDGYTSVAVHVRKGSSNDPPLLADQDVKHRRRVYAEHHWPLKFPPNQYYIDQLRHLITLLQNKKLFIYIFTDHKDPAHLKHLFEETLKEYNNLKFACRNQSISYQGTIVDDLVSMAQFDCLIRSESNFSKVAHFIGNNKLVIYPVSFHWQGKNMLIDKVIIFDSYKGKEYSMEQQKIS